MGLTFMGINNTYKVASLKCRVSIQKLFSVDMLLDYLMLRFYVKVLYKKEMEKCIEYMYKVLLDDYGYLLAMCVCVCKYVQVLHFLDISVGSWILFIICHC